MVRRQVTMVEMVDHHCIVRFKNLNFAFLNPPNGGFGLDGERSVMSSTTNCSTILIELEVNLIVMVFVVPWPSTGMESN